MLFREILKFNTLHIVGFKKHCLQWQMVLIASVKWNSRLIKLIGVKNVRILSNGSNLDRANEEKSLLFWKICAEIFNFEVIFINQFKNYLKIFNLTERKSTVKLQFTYDMEKRHGLLKYFHCSTFNLSWHAKYISWIKFGLRQTACLIIRIRELFSKL